MAGVDLTARPRLRDMKKIGGPADKELDIAVEEAGAALEAARRPKRTPPEKLADRQGYDENFLSFAVALPKPLGAGVRDVLEISGSPENRLNYTHFSVVMSASRRMAKFVAVNIDGKASVKIERDKDNWFLDGRIPDEAQIGEELYADNLMDRGHLVRREDPNWGRVAAQANDDTFHFTNCSPQMGAFNQKTWLSLENYVLKNARVANERITVFTGPVFKSNDRLYRDVRIPTAYWKVIAFVNEEGRPSATAYIVDQNEELKQLEVVFGAFETYQRSVRAIARLSRLDFGDLVDFDGFSNEEVATGTEIAAKLRTPSEIRV